MHMHHGDGVLEYFWAKCVEKGNPNQLTVDAFRYPGKRPQNRETAILAICDALEASSRTLRQPDARTIEALVQRIVYGKLHLGQLDESGLTMAELKTLANTLVDQLRHAHHGRIEYPWQREQRLSLEPSPRFVTGQSLDSADAPRPVWPGERTEQFAAPPPPARAPAAPPDEVALLSDEDKLTPGTLVIGPPPGTQPHVSPTTGGHATAAPPDTPFGDGVPTPVPAVPTQSMAPPKRRPPPPPRPTGTGNKG
jgi:hypothetical protein